MGNLPEQISSLALVFLTGFAWGIYHDSTWSGRATFREALPVPGCMGSGFGWALLFCWA